MSRESKRSVAPEGAVGQKAPVAPPILSPPGARTAPQAPSVIKPSANSKSSCVQPAKAVSKPVARDVRAWALALFEQAPSWLTSIVFHMLLVIALGLIVYNAPARVAPIGFELGGGSGQGGFGGDLEEASRGLEGLTESTQATVDILATGPTVPLQPTIDAPTFDMPPHSATDAFSDMFVKGAIRGDGPGLGTGDGNGTGVGSGNDGPGSGFGTAPTKTQIFGVREEANSFVYVFDRSDSMNSVLSYSSEGSNVFSITPLEAAKAELLRSLEDLTKQQQFQIVFYNNATSLFRQSSAAHHLLMASNANKRRAQDYVSGMPGTGGTYHMPALEAAIQLRPDVIFLLTDGEEKDDPTPDELKALKKMNRGRTRINVIHFCMQARKGSTLERLAKENRGTHLSFLLTKLVPNMIEATEASRRAPAAPMQNKNDADTPNDDPDDDDSAGDAEK